MPLLDVRGLWKSFKGKEVVKDVSLAIEPESVVGLLGENGAGKSTTFKMIVGTLRPDRGEVLFRGKNLAALPMHLRCRSGLGYLAQQATIFRDMTVEQNLLAILEQLSLSRKQRRERCDRLLADFDLTGIRKNKASRCSGGEKRRLEMARALVTEPALMLLDEPFAGVDPKNTGDIRDMIYAIAGRGIAVLITDHDATNTLLATDYAYIMSKGEVIKDGPPEVVAKDDRCRTVYFGVDFTLDDRRLQEARARRESLKRSHEGSTP